MNVSRIRATWTAAACMILIAVAATRFGTHVVPGLEGLMAATYFLPTVVEIGTAAVLFATWQYAANTRSMLVLVLTFGVCGTLTFMQLFAFPLAGSVSSLPQLLQTTLWLALFWHLAAAIGAILYAGLRMCGTDAQPSSQRFTMRALIVALAIVGVGAVTAFTPVGSLRFFAPQGAAGLHVDALREIALALGISATVLVFAIRERNSLDRAFALFLLALTLGMALIAIQPTPFTISWYAGRLLLMAAGTYAFLAAIRTLVSSRMRLERAERLLTNVQHDSERYADRILAVWRIASADAGSSDQRFAAILDAATHALRPGKPVFGYLTRLEGNTIHVEAVSWTGTDAEARGYAAVIHPDATFPLETTMLGPLYAAGCTQAWDDLDTIAGENMVYRELGWRSMIAAPMHIGRHTYFVTFASPACMTDDPFTDNDIAYVDVVASFFGSRFAQQQQFERIQFQAEHDALTGLPNRVQFRKSARIRMKERAPFAIAIVDLNGFRHINEAEGHLVADELLVEVASTLRGVNEDNLVARLGGDEFAVLMRGVSTTNGAQAQLDAYIDVFRRPFGTGDRDGSRTITIGASIGAALFPDHADDIDELLHRANVAMTLAKQRGGTNAILFDQPLEMLFESSRIRTSELADGIARNQLMLVYQPTFDLRTREIVGAEALVRWNHPERGRLAPAEFISLAERTGLIGPLSHWVMKRLLADLRQWTDIPDRFRCYMNLAPQQLGDAELIAEMRDQLGTTTALTSHFGVEITETAVMRDVERSTETIELFRQWGLRVAIDDFGTGYSSLSYLKRLPVDMIKIDRSFVSGLPNDEKDRALCEMLLRMSERFGLATLAEGIETEEQAACLRDHGCRFGQGYLVSKPLTFDELTALVGRRVRTVCGETHVPALLAR